MSTFLVSEVVAASCAIHRENNGFYKKYQQCVLDGDKRSNSNILYAYFFENEEIEITDEDKELANKVIEYLKGLGFKALERKLTSFESNVLEFVSAEHVPRNSLGIAASLPDVYLNKMVSDRWAEREAELGRTSEFLGVPNERSSFTATVEFVRFIPSTGSYIVTASVDNRHILKFFTQEKYAKMLTEGSVINVTGTVKNHVPSAFTGFNETMINRIKLS